MNKEKIESILAFCVAIAGINLENSKIIESSPDYIFEKFESYIGTFKLQDSLYQKIKLNKEFVEFLKQYCDKWNL